MARKAAPRPESAKRSTRSGKTARTNTTKAAPQTPPIEQNGTRCRIRVYRQGLGDCILVRITRKGKDDFKLLIDCGVVLGTTDPAPIMSRVVEDIVRECKGFVDVLAITHQHWDHVSGFIQAGKAFEQLKVGAVWVAWTEDADDPLAKTLKDELGKAEKTLVASAKALHAARDDTGADLLSDLAATQLGITPPGMGATASSSTSAAFDIAKQKAGPNGLRLCRPKDVPFEIPGVNARIYVLGPPHDERLIRKINPSASAPETYALALTGGGALPLGVVAALGVDDTICMDTPFQEHLSIPLDVGKKDAFFQRHYYNDDDWRRIDGDWLGPASELALALQSYTNNTSLVLAIELGDAGSGDVLLFAADAQVGNWESWQYLAWPPATPRVTGPELLNRTIFYKVGHHGSHNATMKKHGLEMMPALKAAVIPVDETMARKKHWGRMPLDAIVEALTQKVQAGFFLRTDKEPGTIAPGVNVSKDFFEITV